MLRYKTGGRRSTHLKLYCTMYMLWKQYKSEKVRARKLRYDINGNNNTNHNPNYCLLLLLLLPLCTQLLQCGRMSFSISFSCAEGACTHVQWKKKHINKLLLDTFVTTVEYCNKQWTKYHWSNDKFVVEKKKRHKYEEATTKRKPTKSRISLQPPISL